MRERVNANQIGDLNSLLQRDLNDFRVANELIPYLTKDNPQIAFFPAVLAVLIPKDFLAKTEDSYYPTGQETRTDNDNRLISYGELWKLETSHEKLKEGKIEIPGGKKSNHRFMELESHQVLNLYDYMLQARPEILKESGKQTDQLFISLTVGKSTISNLVNSFLKPLRRMYPQLKNAKQIRASVITKWLKTYNLREVQHLAGHRYISTTESYQQNDMEGLKEEINQYHPL